MARNRAVKMMREKYRVMARYVDAEHLFKCETCRHHRSGGCDTWCENGECYSPDMSKIPTADVMEAKWISVKDRLPNKTGKYLICNEFLIGKIDTCRFATNLRKIDKYKFKKRRRGWYHYGDYGFSEVYGVTHWMPLPTAPGNTNGGME